MWVFRTAINCNLNRGYTWDGEKGQQQSNQSFSVKGWHEFSVKFIATDVTLIG
jgi:hypothetical protein